MDLPLDLRLPNHPRRRRPEPDNRVDPFDLTDAFKRRFRVGKAAFNNLVERLTPHLRPPTTSRGVPIPIQILIFLRFLATASFQMVIGDTLTWSQPTVCRIIHRVATAVIAIKDDLIRFLDNEEASMAAFRRLGGFPGVIGCVDGR